MLAAFHFAIEQGVAELVAPVCMASSGISFPGEVLTRFDGKRVRVFLDDDAEGAAAFARWAEQMRDAGAVVDGFTFDGLTRADGEPVKDLNDVCQLSADSWEQWGEILNSCMRFLPTPPPAPTSKLAALQNMRHTDAVKLSESAFANDPLILKAIDIFSPQSLIFSNNQPEAIACPV
jgi:hypothetical protein